MTQWLSLVVKVMSKSRRIPRFTGLFLATTPALVLSVAAGAADLPQARPFPPQALPLAQGFDWTGPYVGANIGYGFSSRGVGVQTTDPNGSLVDPSGLSQAVLFPSQFNTRRDGLLGGAQFGYNSEIRHYVFGFEADFDGLRSRGTTSTSSSFFDASKAPFPNYVSDNAISVQQDWLSTVRGRLGYAFGPLLVYGTGGLAIGSVSSFASFAISNVGNPPADVLSGNTSSIRAGYAVGGGVEYAIGHGFSVKAEYLYYDLGSLGYKTIPDPFTTGDIPGVSQTVRARFDGNVVRAGLNYHFVGSEPAPVVARY